MGHKKQVEKIRVQKAGSLLFIKRRHQAKVPLLFSNNIDPAFCTLQFAFHILDPIFFKFQALKIF